jgi:hypothetical protein
MTRIPRILRSALPLPASENLHRTVANAVERTIWFKGSEMIKVLSFPMMTERQHPLIQPLLEWSDEALIHGFQDERDRGCYFIALYCRYAPLVYSVLQHHGKSPVQVDYLFAKMWHTLFFSLDLVEFTPTGIRVGDEEAASLRNWIVNRTATLIQEDLPGIEYITYTLKDAPPPLWCYLEASLAYLPALTRLVLVTTQTFHWSLERVRAYLEVQGETVSLAELQQHLEQGLDMLGDRLPSDVREIYLTPPSSVPAQESDALFPDTTEQLETNSTPPEPASHSDSSIDTLLEEWELILSS